MAVVLIAIDHSFSRWNDIICHEFFMMSSGCITKTPKSTRVQSMPYLKFNLSENILEFCALFSLILTKTMF